MVVTSLPPLEMLGLAPVVFRRLMRTGRIGTPKFLHATHISLIARLGRLGILNTSVLVLAHGYNLSTFPALVKCPRNVFFETQNGGSESETP